MPQWALDWKQGECKTNKIINEKIQLNKNVHTLFVPYDNRKGALVNYVFEKAHFRRRIQQTESILLLNILNEKKATKGQLYLKLYNELFNFFFISETFRLLNLKGIILWPIFV